MVLSFDSAYDVLGSGHKSVILFFLWRIWLPVLDDEAGAHWLFLKEGEVAQGDILAKDGGDKSPQFC